MYKSFDLTALAARYEKNKVLKYDLLRVISKRPGSQEDLNKRRIYSDAVYLISSIWRFNLLKTIYVKNKAEQEIFPIIGNFQLSEGLKEHLKIKEKDLKKLDRIKVTDLGAAGGALTSLYILKVLDEFNLLHKVDINLVDIAEEALVACKKLDFKIPLTILNKHGFRNYSKKDFDRLLGKLKEANFFCCDMTQLPDMLDNTDIAVTGFAHHHLNLPDKEKACRNILKIAKTGAFIGVTDENLDIRQYLKWCDEHANEVNELGEKVPIAMESFIELYDHIELFGKGLTVLGFKEKDAINQPEHYMFWGVKNGKA